MSAQTPAQPQWLNIDEIDFKGKKVFIRADFNVPIKKGVIKDDTRIRETLPTIRKVTQGGGMAILASHLGRPEGVTPELTLRPIAEHLSKLLGQEVHFSTDCIGQPAADGIAQLKEGDVLLLENLRFYKQEEKGDMEFTRKLAQGIDMYINDAFGTAHRAHASTALIAQFFPEASIPGYIMRNELESLNKVLFDAKKPYTAILGGAKVSTKITIIENLLNKVDNLIIGGGMTYTFIKAMGGNIGKSLVEDDHLDTARQIMATAKRLGAQIHLPIDSVNADKFDNEANISTSDIDQVPDGMMGLDVGPKTIELFSRIIGESATLLWNGPVGVFEMSNFAKGTQEVGKAIVEATAKGAFSLVGGGDSVAAVNQFGIADKVSYVSTGGGAMLEFLEGKELPGIKALMR